MLFGVVFFWTPPHFWALAIKFRDDYAAAGPDGWAMVATSLVLTWWAGWVYGACAVALGGWFLAGTYRLRGQLAGGAVAAPMRLFHASIAYLTLLFTAVAVAALLPGR